MTSVFNFENYRQFLKSWLDSQDHAHGLQSRMCKAMECQNSHLTRVLKEEVHLTMDQAFRLSRHLDFNSSEAHFFLKLTEHDRAVDAVYRKHLQQELSALRLENENLSKKFKQQRIENSELEMLYYSSWHWVAIHYLTAIEKFQTSAAIASRIGIQEKQVRSSLEILQKYGLVKKVEQKWQLNSTSIFLPKTSPLNSVQHGNWRSRAVLKSQDPEDDGLHFTMLQTLSLRDFSKIKTLLLKTIEDYRAIADPSHPEEMINLSIDFFRV